MYDINSKQWTKYPISEHNSPKDGYVCYCNKYWIVTEDNCVLKFNKSSFQYNSHDVISDKYVENFPNCTSQFIEVLYFPQEDRYV